jgi:hypothetical protein
VTRAAAVIAPGTVVMAMIYAWRPLSGLAVCQPDQRCVDESGALARAGHRGSRSRKTADFLFASGMGHDDAS